MAVALANAMVGHLQRLALAGALALAVAGPAFAQAPPPEQAGVLALQAGDFDRAASLFADALRQSPRNPTLQMGAGVAAHYRGRDDDARRFLTRALELQPRYTAAAALLGEIVYEQGDVDAAIRIYEQALKYSPTSRDLGDRLKLWRDDAAKERLVDGPFSIAFDGPAEARLALHARTVLEAAYWRIGNALGAYPSQPIEVVFYSLERFRDMTGAPEWAVGSFDTRIRIPVQGALANPITFDRVLTHELAHAMIAGIARSGVPAWLHEGLATYLEPGDVSRATVRWRSARTVIPLEKLQGGFSRLTERGAQVAYDQSVVAASILMERLGTNMALLLHDLDRGNELPLAMTRVGFAYTDFEGDLAGRLK
jgi:tetratricopeptide (TPR) repeat protein